jgi:hypothetical protein
MDLSKLLFVLTLTLAVVLLACDNKKEGFQGRNHAVTSISSLGGWYQGEPASRHMKFNNHHNIISRPQYSNHASRSSPQGIGHAIMGPQAPQHHQGLYPGQSIHDYGSQTLNEQSQYARQVYDQQGQNSKEEEENQPDTDQSFRDMAAEREFSPEDLNHGVHDKFVAPMDYIDTEELLPQDAMDNSLAGSPEVYMTDRLIYSNKRDRNLEGADFIRGDLYIAPDARDWFQVSARPNISLRQGAMNHIGPEYEEESEAYPGDLELTAKRPDLNSSIRHYL